MSKINLNLDLNPETPFTQSQADALSSLVYAYSDGHSIKNLPDAITQYVEERAAKAESPKTEEAPTVVEEKPKATRNRAPKTTPKVEEVQTDEQPAEEAENDTAVTEEANEVEETVSADDIKLIVGKKVEKNREAIKAKLTAMGAESLPKFLAAGNGLAEFKSFLEALD